MQRAKIKASTTNQLSTLNFQYNEPSVMRNLTTDDFTAAPIPYEKFIAFYLIMP
jgi:hypothetical protein